MTFLLALSLVVTAAYLAGHFIFNLRWPTPKPRLLLLLILALSVRWLFLLVFPNPDPTGDVQFDAVSFRQVSDIIRGGNDVYLATGRHPYLPFHMYVFQFAGYFEDHLPLWNFFSWVRWVNILADIGILVLIYRGSLRLGRSANAAFWLGFLWAVQPVSILTSVLHGQFDSVAAFFALYSWYLLRFWPGYRGVLLGGLALGFGVLDKTWPIMFVPVFLFLAPGLRGKGLFLMAVVIVPLFFYEFYDYRVGTSQDLIYTRVIEYQSVSGRFGYMQVLRAFVPVEWFVIATENSREILIAAYAVIAVIVIPRRDALASCSALVATFYAFTFGFGSQYMIWIIPFALAGGQIARVAVYSAVAIPALFLYYWGTCGLSCPGFLSDTIQYWPLQWIWPVAIGWLVWEIQLAMPFRHIYAPLLARLRPQESSAQY